MLVLLGISGMALPPALAGIFADADRVAPPGTATEAFAWIGTAFEVGLALGAAGTGLIQAGRLAFLPAPALAAAATGYCYLTAPARHRPAADRVG
jgi:predicted MFS family arabinose efflux permease